VPEWRTDQEIIDAAEHLKATFVWLKEDEFPSSGYPRAHIDAIFRDRDIFLSVDPQKLYDEYDRMHQAARSVGDNSEAETDLDESIRHLANWTGEGAEAFKRQMTKMKVFCDSAQGRLLRGLQCVAAAYKLAIEGRDSYYKLIKATEAAARNAKEDAAKEDAKLQAAVLFNVVEGVFQLNPGSLLGTMVVTAVQSGKDGVQRIIEGDDSDQVMESYRSNADWLCEGFGMGFDEITKDLGHQVDDANRPDDMYTPLPLICDVRSPDFRYEHFENTIRDTGPIGPIVEEERRKYADEKAAAETRTSEIERRLGHGRGRGVQ
jgi:hypothetical protein